MEYKEVVFRDLQNLSYQEAFVLQQQLMDEVIDAKSSKPKAGFLLFVEHPHVYTLGKSGSEGNLLIDQIQLLAKNAEFYKTNRGGDITYHGPGQIVGYPILNLDFLGLGVKAYVDGIEEAIINTLNHFGLSGKRMSGATGVWLDPDSKSKARKICAIGVRVSRAVTMHGFAFNVNTDLSYFNYINPCGFIDKGVTSLSKELNSTINIEHVKALCKLELEKSLGIQLHS